MADQSARLAVLIDAENTSYTILDKLFAKIAGLGVATVRRAYGDFTNPSLAPWKSAVLAHSIVPVQHGNNTKGKNASDIGLVIEALDFLHSGRFHAFCIVSSDGDFTRLAIRIREGDMLVYGFGEQKTPQSLVSACHEFIYTDKLGDRRVSGSQDSAEPEPARTPDIPIQELRDAVETASDDSGWSNLGHVGNIIKNRMPNFVPGNYGYPKLTQLVEATKAFEFKPPDGGPGAVLVRPIAKRRKAK